MSVAEPADGKVIVTPMHYDSRRFHDDPECHHVRQSVETGNGPKPVDREMFVERGYELCSRCAGETTGGGAGGVCPLCDEEYERALRDHLPCR